MESLKVKTDQFEGPMDLLLFLIQKHELDVSAISIHLITDQYLQHVEMMRELNFDVASDFLVMAATLIHLKSKRLLPDDVETAAAEGGETPTSEAELVRRLMEYKKFQEAGRQIFALPKLGEDVFTRPGAQPPERQTIWREMDITGLTLAFQDVLKRSRKRTKIIIREPTSIPERIADLGKILKPGEMMEFASLLSSEPDRSEIIVTFIALLELSRLKKVRFYQNAAFGSIYVKLTASLDEFDPAHATGFQYNVKRGIADSVEASHP